MRDEDIKRLSGQLAVVASCGLVDADWYLRTYPDVAEADEIPAIHYLFQGWIEGRDPGPNFATDWYRAEFMQDQDPRCPLIHYLEVGWQLGAATRPGQVASTSPPLGAVAGAAPSIRWDSAPAGAWSPADLEARSPWPATRAPQHADVRLVAHYLPQFHQTKENDEFWGDGFTDWVNVRKATPRVPGQYQPHVPLLGEYDLLDRRVLAHQSDLARRHGISAFCFYTYWFDGRKVLSQPLEHFLQDKQISMEFMICWANENWSRNWDGGRGEVLLEQRYPPEWDVRFIRDHAEYLRDPRYVRIGRAPAICVYRVEEIPDPKATADRWRSWCRHNGIGEIHLIAVQSFSEIDPREIGFDAAVEFWPNNGKLPEMESGFPGHVYDWTEFVNRSYSYVRPPYRLYRGVCASWDNEARQPGRGTYLEGSTPDLFRQWLLNAARESIETRTQNDDGLVFVNAWNEWAEGCHLEPDSRWGYQWLHACRDVQDAIGRSLRANFQDRGEIALARRDLSPERDTKESLGVLVVVHDLHPHGVQYLALGISRAFAGLGHRVSLVSLEDGPLKDECPDGIKLDIGRDIQSLGFRPNSVDIAIVCSLAAAPAIEQVWGLGPKTIIQLVNELPGIVARRHLVEAAERSAELSDVWVYPSAFVRDRIEEILGVRPKIGIVQPQGIVSPAVGSARDAADGVEASSATHRGGRTVVCGAGYADYRKGFDRFVELAAAAPDFELVFRWIGHVDMGDERIVTAWETFCQLPNAEWIPHSGDYRALLAESSVLVLTSREDPFPNVVIDSFVAGLPVVAFAGCTGAEEAILEFGGEILPDDSIDACLIRIIDFLARHEAVPDEEIRARRLKAQADFSIEHYARKLATTFSKPTSRIGIGIPIFNHRQFLSERLRSIKRQTLGFNELFVLDDHSTDGSFEVAQALLGSLGDVARVTREPTNSGFVFGQWRKIAKSMGSEFVWIAESDDSADESFLSTLMARFEDETVGMVFSQAIPLDANGTRLAESYLDYYSTLFPWIDWESDQHFSNSTGLSDCFLLLNPVMTVSSVVFRRRALLEAFQSLEGVIDQFPRAGDWLVYAALLSIHNISYVARPLTFHRRHSESVIGSTKSADLVAEICRAQREVGRILKVDRLDPLRASHVQAYLDGIMA